LKDILLLNLLKKLDNSKRSGVAVDCEFDIHAQVGLCPLKLAQNSHVRAMNTSITGFKINSKKKTSFTLSPLQIVPIASVSHSELWMHPGQRKCSSNPSSKNIRY
jgi:hypothetical protein